jgi:hypothetical protein
VEIFFDFVHPQVRVLHRPSFLSWIENGNFASDSHSILLILAICGLAGRFSGRPEVDLFDLMLLRALSSPPSKTNRTTHASSTANAVSEERVS